MPTYPITAPDGRVFPITGDSPPTEQELEEIYASLPPASSPVTPKVSPSGRTPDQESIAQAFIAKEQRPTLNQAMDAALGLGSAVIAPFTSAFKALPAIPEVVSDPSILIPTAAESARRLGIDIVNLGTTAVQQLPGMLQRGPIGTLQQQLAGLAPRTPSEDEIDAVVAAAPFEQAIAQERQTSQFAGAQPEIAEAVTQVVEALPPIKGIQALRGVNVAKASPARILRAAVKPGKQFGSRVEKATENTIGEIFEANPNADKIASMPFEGFQKSVAELQRQVGTQIDEGLRASGIPINAGNEMASALIARADELVRAGQPAESVAVLRSRAADLTGQVTDMESLREAVTSANRSNSPLFQRTREAANPLRAQAETVANEIIAKVGGKIENDALASVKGPQGATLRKKWSDLNLINQEASKRLNTLINQAPKEIQSSVAGAVTSLEGAAGLVGLVNGFASGIIPLATSAAKKFQRNAEKLLGDSNYLVTSAYDKLRANPPARPQVPVAPVIPAGGFNFNPSTPVPPPPAISPSARLNAAISQSISSQTPIPRLPASVTLAPNFTSTPNVPPAAPVVVGGVPSQAQLAEALQRVIDEQALERAKMLQQGSLGYF